MHPSAQHDRFFLDRLLRRCNLKFPAAMPRRRLASLWRPFLASRPVLPPPNTTEVVPYFPTVRRFPRYLFLPLTLLNYLVAMVSDLDYFWPKLFWLPNMLVF